MGRRKIVRTESEEREHQEELKRRKTESQRARRQSQRLLDDGQQPSTSRGADQSAALERECERKRTLRAKQSDHAKTEIRERDRVQHSLARELLSEDQRTENREINRIQHSLTRSSLSETDRDEIREINRVQHSLARESLSEDQRAENREINRIQHAVARLTEPQEQTLRRLQSSRSRYSRARLNENTSSTSIRRQSDRTRQRLLRERSRSEHAINLDEITRHFLGNMDTKCNKCQAKHFRNEYANRGSYSSCCENGKNLPPPSDKQYPDFLKRLIDGSHPLSKSFLHDARAYNRALSFASPVTKEVRFAGGGPYTYRQVGEYQRLFNTSAQTVGNDIPSFGQLYIIEADEANGIRNRKLTDLNSELLAEMDMFMRQNNSYAAAYIMLKEEEEKAEREARNNEETTPVMKLLFSLKNNVDQRRYNLPRTNEIAAVYVEGPNGEVPPAYVVVNSRGSQQLTTLNPLNNCVEPMLYPLFKPYGENGWDCSYNVNGRKVTLSNYVQHILAVRDEVYDPIKRIGRLFQEWIVDQYLKIDFSRMLYLKQQVNEILIASYEDLDEYLRQKATEADAELGRIVILPSSYTGSPRYMAQAYSDSMALLREFGKPDLFITMTCNPKWVEITENLYAGQTASDRPDIVTRVFQLKYKSLIDFIVKSELFGKIEAYVGTIEFQKRGLPHVHLLFTLTFDSKLNNSDIIDRVIRAEIPDINREPELHDIIVRNNIHQCKLHDRNGNVKKLFPCSVDRNTCSKKFPKQFSEQTELQTGGYAQYRRRNDGTIFTTSDGQQVDNRNVVSYSPQLSKRFACHINVEHVAAVEVVKYIHKYIFKGPDQALIEKEYYDPKDGTKRILHYDEIKRYENCRYLSAPEAAWRIFGYEIVNKSHHVERLDIHLPDQQNVYLKKTATEQEVQAARDNRSSKLLAFFDLNRETSNSDLLYNDVPKSYTWNRKEMKWTPRRGCYNTIGRMYDTSPRRHELFHLRLLLLKVKGPKSFADLKTVDGVEYDTFKQACLERGLIINDEEYRNAMRDAAIDRMPRELRFMFAMLLIHCAPVNCQQLYEEFKTEMSEDIVRRHGENGYPIAYRKIEHILIRHSVTFSDFSMQPSDESLDLQIERNETQEIEADIQQQQALDQRQEGERLFEMCTDSQKHIIRKVMEMFNEPDDIAKCLFIDGPGGTGKTFTYNALFNILRGENKHVMCLAYTGIAASLLPDGCTIHSAFKFGLDVDSHTSSGIKKNTKDFKKILTTDAFIVDEASMISAHILSAIDRSLRDFTRKNVPFGGKVMLLGGDYRQTLPIKKHASRSQIVSLTIKASPLWSLFKQYKLTTNMRAGVENRAFAEDVLKIGEGKINDEHDEIQLHQSCITTNNLLHEIFGEKITDGNKYIFRDRAILAPLNVDVDIINHEALSLIEGEEKTYFSADEFKESNNDMHQYMIEYLHTLGDANFPKSELKLKRNAVVMLVRNLDIQQGLCNGTRLRVEEMRENVLRCEILTGSKKGRRVFIPRITLECDKHPVSFYRRQYPVRLAFAMTVNKSQGQTFDRIGLTLERKQVFSHGQLYVALSRTRSWQAIKIKVASDSENRCINVVYKEVF